MAKTTVTLMFTIKDGQVTEIKCVTVDKNGNCDHSQLDVEHARQIFDQLAAVSVAVGTESVTQH